MLGRKPDSWRRKRIYLSVLIGFLSLGAACQKKVAKVCNWSDDKGLSTAGWSGNQLPDRELSLIFLKGPTEATVDVANVLSDSQVLGTFFVQGSAVKLYEPELEKMTADGDGHLIGNGGYRFRNLAEAKEPVLELRTTDVLINNLVYGSKFLFYAPQKVFNQNLATQFKFNGLAKYVGPIKDDTTPSPTFMYDEQCWLQGLKPASCALQYEAEIQRLGRGIIAFHDSDTQTADLLKILLPNLKAEGYSFKRLDELSNIAAVFPASEALVESSEEATCKDYE